MEVYEVHNICSFSGWEGKRLWELEKKEWIPNKGRLLRKKIKRQPSFEFHKGFKNCGSGAFLFVLQTLIVSRAVRWWKKEVWVREGERLVILCPSQIPPCAHKPGWPITSQVMFIVNSLESTAFTVALTSLDSLLPLVLPHFQVQTCL